MRTCCFCLFVSETLERWNVRKSAYRKQKCNRKFFPTAFPRFLFVDTVGPLFFLACSAKFSCFFFSFLQEIVSEAGQEVVPDAMNLHPSSFSTSAQKAISVHVRAFTGQLSERRGGLHSFLDSFHRLLSNIAHFSLRRRIASPSKLNVENL